MVALKLSNQIAICIVVNKISTLCYRVTRVPVVHLVLTGHEDDKGSPEQR